MTTVGVILAGGKGERLWPLSTQEKPKQLLSIANNKSLLAQTFERLASVIPSQQIWVTTAQTQADAITQDITARLIGEPESRNTAAALLLSCLTIKQTYTDAMIVAVPADHYIPEAAWPLFADDIRQACMVAQQKQAIVLLGVRPTKPTVSYGYIEYNPHEIFSRAHRINLFHEKPTLTIAQQYCAQENMLWNTGIFCGLVQQFLHEFQLHAPQLYQSMIQYLEKNLSYDQLPSISFDHAVMEKSSSSWVVPATFEWYDVGTIDAFLALKNDRSSKQKMVCIDAHNNLVEVPNKLVALVGVDDLCVVEVDHVLLIIKRNQVDQVRTVVQNLKEQNEYEYL